MIQNPTAIIESEWVYTGPAFARSHPIAQRLVWPVQDAPA